MLAYVSNLCPDTTRLDTRGQYQKKHSQHVPRSWALSFFLVAMGMWPDRISHQDVSKRHGRLVALAVIVASIQAFRFGIGTASVTALASIDPKVTQENHTELESTEQQTDDIGHVSIFQVDMELRIKQLQRQRLIRILNQFSTMHKNQRLIRELANQGPDGSHLASAPASAVEAESTGPPPELPRLLAIEERIRRLRHIRRILVAKKAAAESRQELASLRRSPIKKAMLTICGGSLGMCVVAKTYPRISELVRGAKWTSNDKNIWLKDVGKRIDKNYGDLQEVIQPWLGSFQPFIDYFWQARSLTIFHVRT